MVFAENLRRLRLERFFSQAELARRAGLHALTITHLETGATAPASRTVRALAQVLGVEPGELATPGEVAELRRVLRAAEPRTGGAPRRSAQPPNPIATTPGSQRLDPDGEGIADENNPNPKDVPRMPR